ncbi:MAG: hypothetical protein IJ029_06245 [Lachnospiraceae bacterium]|nr:hypothetical protein [Lachnospiraceae bacterium]
MIIKLLVEILILWVWFALYMEIIVRKRGPVGGIFFYPKVMQERVKELGLITEEEFRRRKKFAYILLIAGDILIPLIMIVFVNKAGTYFECVWQYYILFLGMEFYDWLAVDTIWVAKSSWWIIPGTEDLLDTWHSTKIKAFKMPKLVILSIPIAMIVGGICYLAVLM